MATTLPELDSANPDGRPSASESSAPELALQQILPDDYAASYRTLVLTGFWAILFMYFSYTPLFYSDIWGHVNYGLWMLDHGRLPLEDPFTPLAEDVPVINISITGPKNALLEAAVRAAIERGHVIVAAVGNDGPAAPVKYPAAYDGVIAVTAVDEGGRVQLDANRGPAVAFAAPGVNVRAAQLADEYATITGTSFASPIVAARFAELMPQAGTEHATAARDTLIASAKRASEEKRSIVYGYGILRTSITTSDLTAAQ